MEVAIDEPPALLAFANCLPLLRALNGVVCARLACSEEWLMPLVEVLAWEDEAADEDLEDCAGSERTGCFPARRADIEPVAWLPSSAVL